MSEEQNCIFYINSSNERRNNFIEPNSCIYQDLRVQTTYCGRQDVPDLMVRTRFFNIRFRTRNWDSYAPRYTMVIKQQIIIIVGSNATTKRLSLVSIYGKIFVNDFHESAAISLKAFENGWMSFVEAYNGSVATSTERTPFANHVSVSVVMLVSSAESAVAISGETAASVAEQWPSLFA